MRRQRFGSGSSSADGGTLGWASAKVESAATAGLANEKHNATSARTPPTTAPSERTSGIVLVTNSFVKRRRQGSVVVQECQADRRAAHPRFRGRLRGQTPSRGTDSALRWARVNVSGYGTDRMRCSRA